MGQNLWDSLASAAEDEKKRWYQARNEAIANAQNLYERGRQAYADAIRTGQDVLARTPQEVTALGSAIKTGAGAANAGVRAAGNAISLGSADNLEAGTEALFGMGGSGDFGQRYQRQLALQHQADAQAAQDLPEIYKWGGRAGAVAGILGAAEPRVAGATLGFIPGVADSLKAIQGAKRIGFIGEGLPAMAAVGGGAVGGVTQLASDAAQGRPTSARDLAGAIGGGALGGVETIYGGPVLGAAVGGGATGLFQGDDPDQTLNDAEISGYFGRGLGTAGELTANALPGNIKGALGEGLSFAKSWARGEPMPWEPADSATVAAALPDAGGRAGPQQWIKLPNNRYTIADWITNQGRAVESKFGNSAGLTPNQKMAVPTFGDRYLTDHWLPRDIGDFSGGWFGSGLGPAVTDDGDNP
ncbi:hypothetical protein [Phenylobacterium sp.]|jgi:hypothetical protein|uniref:hypothetical protein n=1 Tax=Phenylobacterium sp. TaxID=1871053 RepID=UPI002F4137EA